MESSINIPSDLIQHFEKIYIDEDTLNSKVSQRVLKFFPPEKIQILSKLNIEQDQLPAELRIKGPLSAEQFSRSKKLLHITQFKGQFFKRCPGASQKRALTCCNYHVLNLGQQCNMNCSYCYLQSYLNTPTMKMYSNIEDALGELKKMAEEFPEQPFRVGTGEVIDSLSVDEITLYSRDLIQFFKNYPKWTLEFKTKSNKVDQFLDMDHGGNVLTSWSINPQFIISKEEHGTASLEERLTAARKCADKGYPLSFHIDPMIYFEGWQKTYSDFFEELTRRFKPQEVQVISIGSPRFQPEQRHMMRERFGMDSLIVNSEMFPSEAGKLRYDLGIRTEMYNFALQKFRQIDPLWKVYMCMETPESWIQVFDKSPNQVNELKNFFKPLPKIRPFENEN